MKRFDQVHLLFTITCICLFLTSCTAAPAIPPLESSHPTEIAKPAPSYSPEPVANISRFGGSVILINIDDWDHPTKAVIENNYMTLIKVELTQNKKYPIFYVKFSKNPQLFNKIVIEQAVKSIAEANEYWDFTLIDEEQKLQIDVDCSHTDKTLLSTTINGQQDYFMEQFKAIDKIWQKQTPALKELLVNLNQYGWNIKEMLEERDLFHDGNKEFVVSFGDLQDDVSKLDSYLIRKTKNGYETIQWIDGNGGGEIYHFEWMDFKTSGQTFLYANRANGFSASGFSLYRLMKDKLVEFDGGFPATGDHGGSWIEKQPHGSFKKIVYQEFTDTQGHFITSEYLWDGAKFAHNKSIMGYYGIADKFVYPTYPESVVESYLADHYLKSFGDDGQILNKEMHAMVVDGLKDARDYGNFGLTEMMSYSAELTQERIVNEKEHIVLQVHQNSDDTDSPSIFFTLNYIDGKWKIANISNTNKK
jgi:hypothetical protein